MTPSKYRVLLVSSQPIQNPASLRLMAVHPQLEILVAYCSLPEDKLHASSLAQNPEYLTKDVFDLPLLEGYPWVYVPNKSPRPNLNNPFGLINPGLTQLVREFDCCVVYGHNYVSFWMAILAAKTARKPLLLTTDATYLETPEGGNWKHPFKKRVLPYLYNKIADQVLVPSTASKRFLHSLGVPEEQITITPYVVDNHYIAEIAQKSDRLKLRETWKIPPEALVAVFCAKFLPRKRPQDAIQAFAAANVPNSYLVMVGDGPLSESLRNQVKQLGIDEKVRFIGMVKYSYLPEVYAASDLLVFPSEHEPYGLPVNEAMICGIPVVVSDRIGARYDLVESNVTGLVYPCGNVDALAAILKDALNNRDTLKQMGEAARERMETWSPHKNVEGLVQALEKLSNLH
ncbi:glycosyltransferase family 4 protein [Roseofilum sp. BLCC_M154]|uniref:Glycosyltransferase family 4 protein n=1 Tax=Roseofilum acuticapitatum BLCC-M154 TaxID=3022444 RepID=A0ABT7AMK8_9CYAN|nr:glycosyltransferase family 4 protein [Roseofilum acuticapitatum]MDJ1168130.1 glycosyltransferase family 4 protein [Roseofilum acuticapitatum BLCC-M154]